jgi:hypothetical protein
LNDDLREVSSEIEYLNSLRKRTGKQKSWKSTLTLFGSYFRSHSEWIVEGKTKVLRTILDQTVVSYNHSDQTHELNTRLKVPLDNYVTNSGRIISTPAVIKSFETPLNTRKSAQRPETTLQLHFLQDYAVDQHYNHVKRLFYSLKVGVE